MHRFTAQLALIAYLIGGWLLPATHHHASHDQAVGGGHCACHSVSCGDRASLSNRGLHCAADLGHGAPADMPEHSHEHDTCCGPGASLASLPAAQAAGSLIAASSQPGPDCMGLCALCCAASLLSHLSEAMAIAVMPGGQGSKLVHAGLAGPLPPLPNSLSSRGPPAV